MLKMLEVGSRMTDERQKQNIKILDADDQLRRQGTVDWSLTTAYLQIRRPSAGVPPLPIPNREVKPCSADGTGVTPGRVGRRHIILKPSSKGWVFCFGAIFHKQDLRLQTQKVRLPPLPIPIRRGGYAPPWWISATLFKPSAKPWGLFAFLGMRLDKAVFWFLKRKVTREVRHRRIGLSYQSEFFL